MNGVPTLRCMGQKEYFMDKLFETTNAQTSAHITSNGANRWIALRIDAQATIITMCFAAHAMFVSTGSDPTKLVVTALGLHMAMDLTRYFDMAIRWSVDFENHMVCI